MEQSKKKQIMIGVIAACIVLAVAVTLMRSSEKAGLDSVSDSVKVWVKCSNPECNFEYQLGTKEYFKLVQANLDPNSAARTPALACQKCAKTSVYRANKCEECGKIYFPGVASKQYPDKCSECGYSKLEEIKKKANGGK
jgi:hypothetical protein